MLAPAVLVTVLLCTTIMKVCPALQEQQDFEAKMAKLARNMDILERARREAAAPYLAARAQQVPRRLVTLIPATSLTTACLLSVLLPGTLPPAPSRCPAAC